MISYLKGKLILKKEKYIILDVSGVGYKIFLSKKNLSNGFEIGKEMEFFCFLNVKENLLDLYGFKSQEELELFDLIEQIRGIGPKVALEISSLGPLSRIKEQILAQDESIFDGISGIGKKRALTLMVELTGKLQAVKDSSTDEAEDALVKLGFPRQEVKSVLKKIPKETKTEEKIKNALKLLNKKILIKNASTI